MRSLSLLPWSGPVFVRMNDLKVMLQDWLEDASVVESKRLKKKTKERICVTFAVKPSIAKELKAVDNKWFKKYAETRELYIKETFADELQKMYNLLAEDASSRRAYVLNLDFYWEGHDPCNMIYQFLWRDKRLNLLIYLRSSDVRNVLPLDILTASSVLKKLVWQLGVRQLGVQPGLIIFFIGSLHVYEDDWKWLARRDIVPGAFIT